MVSYFTNMTTQIENTLYKAFLGEDAKVCIAHARGEKMRLIAVLWINKLLDCSMTGT